MEFLPTSFIVISALLLGLIIGSFLDVVVVRFNTGASLNGRSRCLSCGHTLSWYELIPCLSYMFLRGRCRNCHSTIPFRLFAMELITACLFGYVAFFSESILTLICMLVLVSLLIAIAAYDYRHMVIPDQGTLGIGILALVYVFSQSYLLGSSAPLLWALISGIGASFFFWCLWFFSKGRWIGFGDVKLALALGLFLHPVQSLTMVIFSFWIGAAVSLILIGLQYLLVRGQKYLLFSALPLTMKSEVPFAPFLIAAFLIVFVSGVQLFDLISLPL